MPATCRGPAPGEAITTLGAFDLGLHGYVSEEWLLEGTATSYRAVGEAGGDGRWTTETDDEASYQTRIVVCRPDDPARAGGTIVVEWLNVSGGGDGSPDWFFLHRQLMRTGAVWVGVSAQKAGIDGGGFFDSGAHLKAVAPERYGGLQHPGDAFSYDIFAQAAEVLRSGAGPLAGFPVDRVLAVGESQSAVFLVTFVNAVDHHRPVYDGFLVHGRGASGATLDGNMFRAGESLTFSGSQRIRFDARVPVITVQSETDLVMMAGVRGRQEDSDRFRWWEIAGASHFDSYGLIASQQDDGTLSPQQLAALIAPVDEVLGMQTGGPVNSGPQQHYVLNAAISHLEAWVQDGTVPPTAGRIEVESVDPPVLARDELGIAIGGIRSPWVDAPVAVLSGQGHGDAPFSAMFGSTTAFDASKLGRLYPGGRQEYLAAFEKSADAAVAAGFVLLEDREEILELAAAGCPLD